MQAKFIAHANRLDGMSSAEAYTQYILIAPPIELAVFQAKELMEGTIIRWMHRIISNQQQFTTELVQKIHEPSGKLQLHITDKAPFLQLVNQLKVVSQYISSSDCPEMHFSIQPHINGLQQPCSFVGTVAIKEFILMKKYHDFDSYQQVNLFALRP